MNGEVRPKEIFIPGVLEPVVGWRAWQIKNNGAGHYLSSIVYPGPPWEKINKAECINLWREKHQQAPEMSCYCGFYACVSLENLMGRLREVLGFIHRYPIAIGEVSFQGRVIEHETGYRGEFAMPRSIYILPLNLENRSMRHAIKDLETRYGLPVSLFKPKDRFSKRALWKIKMRRASTFRSQLWIYLKGKLMGL